MVRSATDLFKIELSGLTNIWRKWHDSLTPIPNFSRPKSTSGNCDSDGARFKEERCRGGREKRVLQGMAVWVAYDDNYEPATP